MKSKSEIEDLRIELAKADDLEDKLHVQCNLVEALLFHDLKEAEALSKEIIEESIRANLHQLRFKGNTLLLRIYRATQQTDLGLSLVESLINNIPVETPPDEEFLVHNSLVNLYIEKFKNKEALAYAKNIEETLYPQLSTRYKAYFHTDLGKLYDRLSYSDLSIEQYELALSFLKRIMTVMARPKFSSLSAYYF